MTTEADAVTTAETLESSVTVTVENIGGISDTEVTLPPGVTVLTGRNATNRTSFLRAIKAVLGSDEVALKGDARSGSVELEVDGSTYTRTLSRRDGTVVFDGDPYLADSRTADLFAFLLESNDARRAIEQGEDLYEVVMRPIDTEEVDAEIESLQEERAAIEAELAELDRLNDRLPELEAERTQLEAAIEEKAAEIEELEAELEALEGDREGIEVLEERFEDLREARNELERVRGDIEDEERFVEALREDRASLEEDLEGLAESDAELVRELESDIARLRERSDALESTLSQLQSAIQFNERMLDEAPGELLGDDGADTGGSVTDQLVGDDDELVCWTCGTAVEQSAIEETVALLREAHQEKINLRNELKGEIDELQAEKRQVERTEEERRRLERELETVETDLEERTDRLEGLRGEAEALESTVEELEAEIDELQSEDPDERLAVHRELTERRVELDGLEAELSELEADIDGIETRLEEREDLAAQVEEIDAEIEDLRSRIERIEADVVEQFNDHMDAILELLEFENLERIWIERIEPAGSGRDGSTTFDLHVIRTNESGSVYEDTVDHLSESEREVLGLVFALSGYLVYEVADQVPFMLLDSLEALDADRIAMLVDYLAERADNLVVALLREDAQAVDDRYHRLTEI